RTSSSAASSRLGAHEQRNERLGAALRAPVSVQIGVEARAGRQHIRGVEMLTRPKAPRAAVAQADLHFAAQDEDPLRRAGAVPLAAKADRALAQLVAAAGEQRREARLRRAFAERDALLAPARAAVALREQHDFGEAHFERYFSMALGASAMPWPGRSGMRITPSLHSGSSTNRSGGAQSMNSTRKPLARAPTTWIAISWIRC